MISKEEFIKLINDYKKWDDRITQICGLLKVDIFTADWIEYSSVLFEDTISFLFTEEAQEDIFWWLWEKDGRSDMKMWDADGKEIPTETVEDLWEIVKDNRK